MPEITHLQGTVGPLDEAGVAAGQSQAVRTGKAGGFLNSPISASFQEAVLRGRCFTFTAAAGITTQAGLSATTPAATLYNPVGSGVNAILWYASVNFTVVFAAVTSIVLAAGTDVNAAAVTGTASTVHRNCLLGGSNNAKISVLLAATLPAAPVGVFSMGSGLTGAVNLDSTAQPLGGWLNGALAIAPGANVSIQTAAASGASATFCSYIWEEVPITI